MILTTIALTVRFIAFIVAFYILVRGVVAFVLIIDKYINDMTLTIGIYIATASLLAFILATIFKQ